MGTQSHRNHDNHDEELQQEDSIFTVSIWMCIHIWHITLHDIDINLDINIDMCICYTIAFHYITLHHTSLSLKLRGQMLWNLELRVTKWNSFVAKVTCNSHRSKSRGPIECFLFILTEMTETHCSAIWTKV